MGVEAEATLNAIDSPTQAEASLPLVMGGSSNTVAGNSSKHPQHGLSGDFLADGGSRSFCDDAEAVNQAGEEASMELLSYFLQYWYVHIY